MIQIIIEVVMGTFTLYMGIRILGLLYLTIIEGVKE